MLATFDPLKAIESAKKIAESELEAAIIKTMEKYPEKYAALPEEEKIKLAGEFVEGQTTLYCKVGKYAQEKDWKRLLDCVHPSNKRWREVFSAATGIVLPNGAGVTRDVVINQFIGADAYNTYQQEIKNRRDETELLAKRKKEEGLLAEAKATKYRYCMGGIAGTPITVSFEEMARDLISRGFVHLAPAGGLKTCPRYELSDGKGGFVRLRKKYEIIYLRELLAESQLKANAV